MVLVDTGLPVPTTLLAAVLAGNRTRTAGRKTHIIAPTGTALNIPLLRDARLVIYLTVKNFQLHKDVHKLFFLVLNYDDILS